MTTLKANPHTDAQTHTLSWSEHNVGRVLALTERMFLIPQGSMSYTPWALRGSSRGPAGQVLTMTGTHTPCGHLPPLLSRY